MLCRQKGRWDFLQHFPRFEQTDVSEPFKFSEVPVVFDRLLGVRGFTPLGLVCLVRELIGWSEYSRASHWNRYKTGGRLAYVPIDQLQL